MRLKALAAALLTVLVLGGSAAQAESITGHFDGEGFAERIHHVRVVAHRGYLELTVTRGLENLRTKTDEATISIDIPPAAVAVGLRSQGHTAAGPVWFDGELMDAEVAKSRYFFLTGLGQALPKDPAWLYWTSPSSLGLQVFPCAGHKTKLLEYRLLVPMPYQEGRFEAELPPLGMSDHPPTVELIAGKARDRVSMNDHELPPGGTVIAPKNGSSVKIALTPEEAPLVEGELAQTDLGTGRSYLRAELRVSPKLGTIPKNADLLFAFDLSRSSGASWSSQLALFVDLTAQFPGARVAAVGFDRALRPLTRGLVPVDAALEQLRALPTDTRNGSRADLALDALLALIQKEKLHRESTRVFLLTDALVPSSVGDPRIEASIRKLVGITHLVQVRPGGCALGHEPELPWTSAIEATEGTTWFAMASDPSTECQSTFEELARPKRLFVKNIALENAVATLAVPDTLDEGSGFLHEEVISGAVSKLTLEAKLWGKSLTQSHTPDRAMAVIRAALATNGTGFELTDAEAKTLALRGKAVSQYTSYLAIEPGVRPSSDGIDWATGGGIGHGISLGAIGTRSGRAAKSGVPFSPQAYLEAEVDRARIACGIGYLRANVTLETTYAELVDVLRAEVIDAPPSASGCLAEKLWDLALPEQFTEERATYSVFR